MEGGKGAQLNSQKVEISERTLSIIAFGLSMAALVTSLWGMHEAELLRQDDRDSMSRMRTDTQVEMAHTRDDVNREVTQLVREVNKFTIITQDHDALLIRDGLKQPADAATGPTGNLEFKPIGRRQ